MMPSENEANIGRLIALRLGCGNKVLVGRCNVTVPGLQSIDLQLKISTVSERILFSGGTEAMSRAPLIFNKKMTTWFAQMMGSKP